MADAGGVVYLLSSYQSGKERWGRREGERGERDIQEERKDKKEHLVPVGATTFTYTSAHSLHAAFLFARFHGSSLTPLMWEIND